MSESIIAELLAEIEALKQNKATFTKSEIVESLSEFKYEELVDKLKIRGILLSEGTWNGLKYSWDKIKEMFNKYSDKLEKLPLKVEHGRLSNYKDKKVGSHIKVRLNNFLKAIEYEAEITDDKAIEDVKDGKFRATSLTLRTDRIVKDGEELAVNLVPLENSLTAYPACKVCNVFHIEELTSQVNYFGIRLYKKDLDNKLKEVDRKMECLEVKEGQVLVFPDIPEEELFAEEQELEMMVMDEEEAMAKKKRAVRVPPGKYPRKAIKKRIIVYYYPGYGYYYPYEYYPVPYYYWYYYGYPTGKSELEEIVYLEGVWKIVKNKKTGKFTVMKATGKKFPAWKIIGQFDTYEEAKKACKSELAAKCPVCGQSLILKKIY